MKQFDVFSNPIPRARRAYPFVVVLHSDVAQSAYDRVVAPVAPRAAFPSVAGRLTPIVSIEREEFVLLITSLTTLPTRELHNVVVSLAERREDILAAIDYLFFGV